MTSRAWRRSLSGRAAVHYFSLVVLASIVVSGLFYFFWKTNLLKVEQSVHWDVAQELVRRIEQHPNFAAADQAHRQEIILREFYYLAAVNPRIDPYLISSEGLILVSLYSRYRLRPISVRPIERFTEIKGFPLKPIYGDNPLTDDPPKILFSAAPIRLGEQVDAYLYLVTSGQRYWTAFQQFTDIIAIVGTFILLLVVGIVSSGLGHMVFLQLSTGLRSIIEVAEAYANGDFSKRIVLQSDDELGAVAATMNSMAQRISESNEAQAQADAMRRELISNISHDMRHPVAIMHTALETVLARMETSPVAQQKEAIARALQSCKQLNGQLDELFTLAKLNSTDFTLRREQFSIAELAEEVLAVHRPRAFEADLELRAEYSDTLPEVTADIALIERVFTNLIANAIRHTPAGGSIVITLTEVGEQVHVCVADTGSGISPEHLPHIFERYFTQAREGALKGSGLGLAIVKRIMDLHDATMTVDSLVGRGTSFSFHLPRV